MCIGEAAMGVLRRAALCALPSLVCLCALWYMGLLMGLPGMAAARSAAVAGLTGRLWASKDLFSGLPALEVGVLLGVLEPTGQQPIHGGDRNTLTIRNPTSNKRFRS